MNSNSILLIDPAFNPDQATVCRLLIKIGIDSFSYAIINAAKNEVIAVFDEQECENVIEKFEQKLKTDPYLQLPYEEIKIAVCTPNTIDIPTELYDETTAENHAQYFTDGDFSNIHIRHQPKKTTVFALPNKVDELIANHLSNAKIFDGDINFLAIEDGLNIDFTVGSFTLFFIKNGDIIFQKAFDFSNIDEFNYYLLLIISQLNIDVKNTAVNLSGIVHQNDEKYNCIKKYFGNISFKNPQGDLNISVLDDMPTHYYTSLLALNTCE